MGSRFSLIAVRLNLACTDSKSLTSFAGEPPVDELRNVFCPPPLRALVAAYSSLVRGGSPVFSLAEVTELKDCTVEDFAIWSLLTGALTLSFLLALAEVSREGFYAVLNL